MILTCPNCSMRYSASASAIGPNGRKVRCASCGHNWQVNAKGEAIVPEAMTPQPQPQTQPDPVEEATQARMPEPEIRETPAQVTEPEPAPHRPEVAKALRAKREAERQQARRRRSMGIWGGIAASLLVVLATAYVFRVNLVRVWPNTASAFAAVGINVNLYGLEVQDLAASRQLQAGTSVLVVTGKIKNITDNDQKVPLLKTILRDQKTGKVAFSWTVKPQKDVLQPTEQIAFATELRDPPPSGLELQVEFADTPTGAEAETRQHEPAKPTHDTGPAGSHETTATGDAAAHNSDAAMPQETVSEDHGPAHDATPQAEPADNHGADEHGTGH